MQDVNHALANLRSLSGISTLEFDADGNLTLMFDGDILVNIARIDDTTVEFWSELDKLGGLDDAHTMRRILESNHLGEGTGAARIALAPGKDVFVLCERVQVGPLSGDQFGDRLIEFLKYASFWTSEEAGSALAAEPDGSSGFSPDDSMIRA